MAVPAEIERSPRSDDSRVIACATRIDDNQESVAIDGVKVFGDVDRASAGKYDWVRRRMPDV